jgi:hypothetical protein
VKHLLDDEVHHVVLVNIVGVNLGKHEVALVFGVCLRALLFSLYLKIPYAGQVKRGVLAFEEEECISKVLFTDDSAESSHF